MTTACKFCEKEGLPLLLTRFGIAPSKAFMARAGSVTVARNAPVVPASVNDPAALIALGAQSETHYTVRALRTGYLYVYYEVDKSWQAYLIDEASHLSQMPLVSDTPPKAEMFHAACARNEQKSANASLLMIKDPETAGKVWFGFSDAWWTAAVRKANEQVNNRQLHMRSVDVQAWYNQQQPAKVPAHTCPIAEVEQVVADYALSFTDGNKALSWSPFPYQPKQTQSEALRRESERLQKGKGLIVALDDPVGLARELAVYIDKRKQNFDSQLDPGSARAASPAIPASKSSKGLPATPAVRATTWGRQSALHANLETLHQHVEREAEVTLIKGKEQLRRFAEGDGETPNLMMMSDSYRRAAQPLLDAKISKKELDDARTERWKAYEVLFDANQRQAFLTRYKSAAAVHDANFTLPLSKAHVAWLKSDPMRGVFEHHFDRADINSGVGFPAVLLLCVSGTGGLGPNMTLYRQWYEQSVKLSWLWRAQLLNYDPLLNAVYQVAAKAPAAHQTPASANGESGLSLPHADDWANLFAVYSNSIGKLKFLGPQGKPAIESIDLLGNLLREMGALPLEILKQGGAPSAAMLATLGMRAGKPIQLVKVVGSEADLLEQVAQIILKAQGGKNTSPASLKISVAEQLKTLGIDGVPLERKIKFWALVFQENEELAGQGDPTQRGTAAGKTLKLALPSEEPILSVKVYADTMLAKTVSYARLPGALASINVVLSAFGLHNAFNEQTSALKNMEKRAAFKVAALYGGATAAMLDVARLGSATVARRSIPMVSDFISQQVVMRGGLRLLEGAGMAFGGASMLVMGVVDLDNAAEARSREEYGIMGLYLINSISEGGLGLYMGWVGWNIVRQTAFVVLEFNPYVLAVTAIILVTSVIIEIAQEPPTMNWVRQSLWTKGPDQRYASEREETDDFNKAISA